MCLQVVAWGSPVSKSFYGVDSGRASLAYEVQRWLSVNLLHSCTVEAFLIAVSAIVLGCC
jgi:hypothetical protein